MGHVHRQDCGRAVQGWAEEGTGGKRLLLYLPTMFLLIFF